MNDFRKVKNQVNIIDYIETLTGMTVRKLSGGLYETKECPFCGHKDCFRINPNKQTFTCYSNACSSKSGDIFEFVKQYQNLYKDYDALKEVAKHIGYQLPEKTNSEHYNGFKDAIQEYDQQIYNIYKMSINNVKNNPGHCKKIIDYLVTQRGISTVITKKLIENEKVGYSYFNDNEFLIFPIFSPEGNIRMLNQRTISNEKMFFNKGDLKGNYFTLNNYDVRRVKKVYITESIIDALTLMSVGTEDDINKNTKKLKRKIAISTITSGNTDIDFHFLKGKEVFLVKDKDDAGEKWATKLYFKLIDLKIPTTIIDLGEEHKDSNELLLAEGYLGLEAQLQNTEKRTIFNQSKIWRLTANEKNFNEEIIIKKRSVEISKYKTENGTKIFLGINAICNFKIWKIETCKSLDFATDEVAEYTYKVTYSTSNREFADATFSEEKLKDEKAWKRVGIIFSPVMFKQYINLLLHRSDEVKEIKNVVGLNYIKDKPIICDALNTAFPNENMSPYQNLIFKRGSISNARKIFDIYRNLLTDNKGILIINWILGSFIKSQLGFYPHLSIDAESSSGKSTILNLLSTHFKSQRYSGEQFGTRFRRTIMSANSLYPIFVDEASRVSRRELPEVLNLLNQAYNFNPVRRGRNADLYYVTTPMCLLGQDTLYSNDTAFNAKILKINLDDSKGKLPGYESDSLNFPLRDWIEYLINNPIQEDELDIKRQEIKTKIIPNDNDATTERTINNYAIQFMVWERLKDYLGLKNDFGFETSLLNLLQSHLNDKIENTAIDEAIQILRDFSILFDLEKQKYHDLVAYTYIPKTDDIQIAINTTVIFEVLGRFGKEYAINSSRTFLNRLKKHNGLITSGKKTTQTIRFKNTISRRVVLSNNILKKLGVNFSIPEIIKNYADNNWINILGEV